jgi:ketosteroid isomerase-like protein
MPTETTAAQDRTAILDHIKTIFAAYIRKDRAAIRNTHTPDWTGFQGPSVKIERGLDDYMVNAEKSLEALDGKGFELLDTEVQFRGDIAIVYYVARYDYVGADGHAGSVPLRSIDIYQRDGAGWIQCGSHIAVIPAHAKWTED